MINLGMNSVYISAICVRQHNVICEQNNVFDYKNNITHYKPLVKSLCFVYM